MHLNRTGDVVEEMASVCQYTPDGVFSANWGSRPSEALRKHSHNSNLLRYLRLPKMPPPITASPTRINTARCSVSSESVSLCVFIPIFRQIYTFLDSETGTETPAPNHLNIYQNVQSALQTLRSQHAALVNLLQSHPSSEPSLATSRIALPNTVVEEEHPETIPAQWKPSSPSLSFTAFKHSHPHRTSYASSAGDSIHEWFDAEDGPEEYFVDEPNHLEAQPSTTTTLFDSRSMLEESDGSSVDTDLDGNDDPRRSSENGTIVYRSQLPALPSEDEGSLFAILKKNVGKVPPMSLYLAVPNLW